MNHLFSFIGSLFIPSARAAGPEWEPYCSIFGACGEGRTFLITFAFRTGTLVFMLMGGLCVVAIIWAATGLITSAFNEQGREGAKTSIKLALMGLALSIGAASLVQFVATSVQQFTGQ